MDKRQKKQSKAKKTATKGGANKFAFDNNGGADSEGFKAFVEFMQKSGVKEVTSKRSQGISQQTVLCLLISKQKGGKALLENLQKAVAKATDEGANMVQSEEELEEFMKPLKAEQKVPCCPNVVGFDWVEE